MALPEKPSSDLDAARSVNSEMVRSYWLVGREIVEEDQAGSVRAGYGEELLTQISTRLRSAFGRGFTANNLRYMRQFYLAYPELLGPEIRHAVRDESEITHRLNSIFPGPTTVFCQKWLPLTPVGFMRRKPSRTTGRRVSWSDR